MSIALPPLLQGQKELERLWNAGQTNFLPRSLTIRLIAFRIIELIATRQLPIPDQSTCLLGAVRVYSKLSTKLHRDVKYADSQLKNTQAMRLKIASKITHLEQLEQQRKEDSGLPQTTPEFAKLKRREKKNAKKALHALQAASARSQLDQSLHQTTPPLDSTHYEPGFESGQLLNPFDEEYQGGFDFANLTHQDELFSAMNQLAQAGDEELTHIYTNLQRYNVPYGGQSFLDRSVATPARDQLPAGRSLPIPPQSAQRMPPIVHEGDELSDVPLDSDDAFQQRSYYAQSRYSMTGSEQFDTFHDSFHRLDQSNTSVVVRDHHGAPLYHAQSPGELDKVHFGEFDMMGQPQPALDSDFSLGFDIEDLSSFDQDQAAHQARMAQKMQQSMTELGQTTIFTPEDAPFQELREFFFTFNVNDAVLDRGIGDVGLLPVKRPAAKKASQQQQDGVTPVRRAKRATIVDEDGNVISLASVVKKKQIAGLRKVKMDELDRSVSLPTPHLAISHLSIQTPMVEKTPAKTPHKATPQETGAMEEDVDLNMSGFSFSSNYSSSRGLDEGDLAGLRVHFDLGASFQSLPGEASLRHPITKTGQYAVNFDDFDDYGNDDFGIYGDNGFTVQIRDLHRQQSQQQQWQKTPVKVQPNINVIDEDGSEEELITKQHANFLENNTFSNPTLFSPMKGLSSHFDIGDDADDDLFDDFDFGDEITPKDGVGKESQDQPQNGEQFHKALVNENFDFSFISNQSLLLSNIIAPSGAVVDKATPSTHLPTTDHITGSGFDDELFFPTLQQALHHQPPAAAVRDSVNLDTSLGNFSLPASLTDFSTARLSHPASISTFSRTQTNETVFNTIVRQYQNLGIADVGSVTLDGTAQHKLHQLNTLQDDLIHDFTSSLPSLSLRLQTPAKPTSRKTTGKGKPPRRKQEDDFDQDDFDVEFSDDFGSSETPSKRPAKGQKAHSTSKKARASLDRDAANEEGETDQKQREGFLTDLLGELEEYSIDTSISSLSNVFSSYFRINPPHLPSIHAVTEQHLQELQYGEFASMLRDLDSLRQQIQTQTELVNSEADTKSKAKVEVKARAEQVEKLELLKQFESKLVNDLGEYQRSAAFLEFDEDNRVFEPSVFPLLTTQGSSGVSQLISQRCEAEINLRQLAAVSEQKKPLLQTTTQKKKKQFQKDFFYDFINILAENMSPYQHQLLEQYHTMMGGDGKYDVTVQLNPPQQTAFNPSSNLNTTDNFNLSFMPTNPALSIHSTRSQLSTISHHAPVPHVLQSHDFQTRWENSLTPYQTELLRLIPTAVHETPYAESTLNQGLIEMLQFQSETAQQCESDDMDAFLTFLKQKQAYMEWLQNKKDHIDDDDDDDDDGDDDSGLFDHDSDQDVNSDDDLDFDEVGSKKTKKQKQWGKSDMVEPTFTPRTLRATIDEAVRRSIESMQSNEYRLTKMNYMQRKQNIAKELWRLHQFSIYSRLPIYTQPLIIQHYIDMGVIAPGHDFDMSALFSAVSGAGLSSQYDQLQREISQTRTDAHAAAGTGAGTGYDYDNQFDDSYMHSTNMGDLLLQGDETHGAETYQQLNQSLTALQHMQGFQHQLDGDLSFDFNLSSDSSQEADLDASIGGIFDAFLGEELTPTRMTPAEAKTQLDQQPPGSAVKRQLGTTMSGIDFSRLDTSLQHDLNELLPQFEEQGDLWPGLDDSIGSGHDVFVRDSHAQRQGLDISRDSMTAGKHSTEFLPFEVQDQLISNESYMGDLYSDGNLDLSQTPAAGITAAAVTPTSSFIARGAQGSPTQLQSLSDTIHDLHHWAREQDELRSARDGTGAATAQTGSFEKTLTVLGYDSKYLLHLIIQLYKETQEGFKFEHNVSETPVLAISLSDLITRRRDSILTFYQQYNKSTHKVTQRRVASSTFFLLLHLVKHGLIFIKQASCYDSMSISLHPL